MLLTSTLIEQKYSSNFATERSTLLSPRNWKYLEFPFGSDSDIQKEPAVHFETKTRPYPQLGGGAFEIRIKLNAINSVSYLTFIRAINFTDISKSR